MLLAWDELSLGPTNGTVLLTIGANGFSGSVTNAVCDVTERYLRCATRHMSNLVLLIIVLVLLFGWGGGLAMHAGGNLIHALLVIAIIVVVVRLVTGRRAL
jgi:hypothetical protein